MNLLTRIWNNRNKIISFLELIVTVGSTLATAYFAWTNYNFSKETLDLNKHTVEVADKENLQEQASKIAAWNGGINDKSKLTVTLSNNSDMPIYNVILATIDSKLDYGFKSIEQIIRDSSTTNTQYFKMLRVVSPGKHQYVFYGQDSDMGGGAPMIAILFTDTRNHGWLRSIDGKLIQRDNYLSDLEKFGLTKPYLYDDY